MYFLYKDLNKIDLNKNHEKIKIRKIRMVTGVVAHACHPS
jgi:hypothetical protein